jgi:hypothetical protein
VKRLARLYPRRWRELPSAIRTHGSIGSASGTFSHYDDRGRTLLQVEAAFERAGDGWIVSSVRRIWPAEPWEPQLIP